MTPNMRRGLEALAKGERPPCGIPTKQRLVKFGLARWKRNEADATAVLERILHPGDRELEITPKGRDALALLAAAKARRAKGDRS